MQIQITSGGVSGHVDTWNLTHKSLQQKSKLPKSSKSPEAGYRATWAGSMESKTRKFRAKRPKCPNGLNIWKRGIGPFGQDQENHNT